LIFPELSEERRKELVKIIKKSGEDAKVAVRNIRREAIEHFKAEEKSKNITEDDLRNSEKEVQNLTDKYVEKIDKIVGAKETEIMEV
jgi:ribosome recycling factor